MQAHLIMPNKKLPTVVDARWHKATNRARQVAEYRQALVEFVLSFTRAGFSQNTAVNLSLERLHLKRVNNDVLNAYVELTGKTTKVISRSTIC